MDGNPRAGDRPILDVVSRLVRDPIYPCRKTRTETQWCYEFERVKVTKWGIYCQYDACEAGKRYTWSDWYCLGVGSGYVYNVRRCFSTQRKEVGTC